MRVCLAVACHLRFGQNDSWPGSFTCYRGNTGVERIPEWVSIESWSRKRKFSLRSFLLGLESKIFRSRARRSTAEPSPMNHVVNFHSCIHSRQSQLRLTKRMLINTQNDALQKNACCQLSNWKWVATTSLDDYVPIIFVCVIATRLLLLSLGHASLLHRPQSSQPAPTPLRRSSSFQFQSGCIIHL